MGGYDSTRGGNVWMGYIRGRPQLPNYPKHLCYPLSYYISPTLAGLKECSKWYLQHATCNYHVMMGIYWVNSSFEGIIHCVIVIILMGGYCEGRGGFKHFIIQISYQSEDSAEVILYHLMILYHCSMVCLMWED